MRINIGFVSMEMKQISRMHFDRPTFCFTRRDDDNDDRGFFGARRLYRSPVHSAASSLEYNMRRSSVHHPRVVLVAPEIILAIVSPLSSLTSIRIGFGLELSIAKPVRSEVLKRNRIAATRR